MNTQSHLNTTITTSPSPRSSNPIIQFNAVNKTYAGGFNALNSIDLSIQENEIFALLGPNGAGKTTLISCACALTNITSGTIKVGGFDVTSQPYDARKWIGLVPQELTTDMFTTVLNTVRFSRGLFGLPKNDAFIEDILKKLSLWDKKDNKMMTLSGGMKRRVMIAKALAHEPKVLFLDEPTAGVDVELRKDMWKQVRKLKESGVTIILTTHYIEEAEEMADRIGIINKGKLVLVDQKANIIQQLGKKAIFIDLKTPVSTLPDALNHFNIQLIHNTRLKIEFDSKNETNTVSAIFDALLANNLQFQDIESKQSSLEEIFVELINQS